jgi:DNA repair protein RecN (Recombination protein N)
VRDAPRAGRAQAHSQFRVTKRSDGKITRRRQALGAEERVDEIARMLGGIDITEQARAHAREMLGPRNAAATVRRRSARKAAPARRAPRRRYFKRF